MNRYIFPQELSVPKCDPARPIDLHCILIKLTDLYNDTCLVPLVGVRAHLILNADMVTNSKRWKSLGVFR